MIKSNGRNGTKPYVNEYLIECPPINVSQSIPRKSIKSAAAMERIVNLIRLYFLPLTIGASIATTINDNVYPPHGPIRYPIPVAPQINTGTPTIPRSIHTATTSAG